MSNETSKFNIAKIEKHQQVVEVETGKLFTISDIEKRGRWHYISVVDHNRTTLNAIEYSEGKFFARFSEFKAPKQADTKAPRVKKVSEAKVQDAMTASDIEDGTIEGLTGFAKFRAVHKAVTVELPNSGIKVKVQDNGDDIAHQILCEIDEIMEAKGCEAAEAIWLIPIVKNNLDVKALQARYSKLNYGQIRMNIGNMLRNIYRKAAQK